MTVRFAFDTTGNCLEPIIIFLNEYSRTAVKFMTEFCCCYFWYGWIWKNWLSMMYRWVRASHFFESMAVTISIDNTEPWIASKKFAASTRVLEVKKSKIQLHKRPEVDNKRMTLVVHQTLLFCHENLQTAWLKRCFFLIATFTYCCVNTM